MKPLESKGECEVREHGEVRVITLRYGNMWFCRECWELEQKLSAENQSATKQQERVNNVLTYSKKVDSQVELKSDIFNAETVAIVELKAAIENNPEIENKTFALAEAVAERRNQYNKAIFEKRQEIESLQNKQRATQSILNELANRLHQEERDKLKLQDVTYQPKAPKKIKPASEPKVTAKSFKLQEVKKFAEQYGVPASGVQTLVAGRNISPEAAAKELARMLGK